MKTIPLKLSACRKNSGLTTKEIVHNLKHSTTWLSLVENGKRRIYADELFELMKIYGLMDLSFSQISLPTQLNKISRR